MFQLSDYGGAGSRNHPFVKMLMPCQRNEDFFTTYGDMQQDMGR